MYLRPNLSSKKAYKEALKSGQTITAFQPNDLFGVGVPENGVITFEGPHYPKPHRFYGEATLRDGKVVKIS